MTPQVGTGSRPLAHGKRPHKSIAASLPDDLCHGPRFLVPQGLETRDDAAAVGGVSILTRLPLAADVGDLDFDPDDRLSLKPNEILRGVGDRPRLVARRL